MPGRRRKQRSSKRSSRQFFDSKQLFTRPDSWLVFTTDVLIGFLILGFPFIMGGREAWGHATLITTSLMLGAVWSIHKARAGGRLLLTGAEVLAIGGMALLWVQATPVGDAVLNRISPEYTRLTTAWGITQQNAAATEALPAWSTISLMPYETRHAMWILLSYILVGAVTAQRIRSSDDAERVLKLVAISGVGMAAFGAAQFTFSNDLFFWFYRNPFTGTEEVVKGAFTNRNHFAQFLVLSLGPLLWWLTAQQRVTSDSRGIGSTHSSSDSLFDRFMSVPRLMLICAVGTVLLCIMLSLSRGGMVAASVAVITALAGLARTKQMRASVPMMVLLLGGVAIGGLLVFGSKDVETRVNQLASVDADKIDQMSCRRAIWAADIDAISHFPLLGTGVGSHREIYPTYMKDFADFSNFEFTHAESSWIHLALETGVAGVALLALGILLFAIRMGFGIWRRHGAGHRDILTAAFAALLAASLHAIVDFIWYVPAIVVVTIVLCITGIRAASGFRESRGLIVPRIAWVGAACLCMLALIRIQPHLYERIAGEHWWYRYLIASFDAAEELEEQSEDQRSPAQVLEDRVVAQAGGISRGNRAVAGYPTQVPSEADLEVRSMKQRLSLLIRSLNANPHQPRAQIRMATLCLKLFDQTQQKAENPMSLAEIRDTAVSAGFASSEELHAWLNRAFGPSVKLPMLADELSRRSLSYCPVQGAAFLTLLDTGFLRDPSDEQIDTLLKQTLVLRQYDPRAQFVAGQIAVMSGDQPRAMKHWGMVFHANRDFRESIMLILAKAVPASTLLAEFQPTVTEFPEVLKAYARVNRQLDIEQTLAELRRVTEEQASKTTTEERIGVLMEGYEAAWKIGLVEDAEDLLRRAAACDDMAYWPRHALGLLLFDQQRYEEAGELFAWCYDQQPGDTKLERLVRESRRLALQQQIPVMNTSFRR